MNSPEILQLFTLHSTGQTRRYHTRKMIQTQTVGDHTYGVLMVLHWLTHGEVPRHLLLYALFHDSGERFTGDVPGPTKRVLGKDFKADLDEMEARVLLERTGAQAPPIGAADHVLVKAADYLEGAIHCLNEAHLGNRTSSLLKMLDRYLEYISELDFSVLSARQAHRCGQAIQALLQERQKL